MLLFDPESWKRWHRTWFHLCALLAVLALGWFVVEGVRTGSVPRGSSAPGLVAGVVAGLLFFYLFAYGVRKWPVLSLWFSLRPTKFWLGQHIWLGLLTIPLVLIHGWNGIFVRWGLLTVPLLIVYAVVILSGIWGLWRQQSKPHTLLEEIPDETIRSQIPDLLHQLQREAQLLVLATCGPPRDADGTAKALQILKENGAIIRASRSGKGAGLLRILPPNPIPNTEPIRVYFEQVVSPYLDPNRVSGGTVLLSARLKQDFNELRGRLPTESHSIIDALEQLCERRQQFDHQAGIHVQLHNWIVFHLVFSAILLFLLVWHAISAIQNW